MVTPSPGRKRAAELRGRLHELGWLPRSKLDILDAGHFTWEDAADQYAALITTWWSGGYTATS